MEMVPQVKFRNFFALQGPGGTKKSVEKRLAPAELGSVRRFRPYPHSENAESRPCPVSSKFLMLSSKTCDWTHRSQARSMRFYGHVR